MRGIFFEPSVLFSCLLSHHWITSNHPFKINSACFLIFSRSALCFILFIVSVYSVAHSVSVTGFPQDARVASCLLWRSASQGSIFFNFCSVRSSIFCTEPFLLLTKSRIFFLPLCISLEVACFSVHEFVRFKCHAACGKSNCSMSSLNLEVRGIKNR